MLSQMCTTSPLKSGHPQDISVPRVSGIDSTLCFLSLLHSVSAWAHEQAVRRLEEKEAAVADDPMTD